MVKDKKKEAKAAVAKYVKYEACLMKDSDAIIDALADSDYAAIDAIFAKCKVPAEERPVLLQQAIDCYETRYHQW